MKKRSFNWLHFFVIFGVGLLVALALMVTKHITILKNKLTELKKIDMPADPVGFIAGLNKRDEYQDANHLVSIGAIVQIPNGSKKNVRFGFLHKQDPLTLYILPTAAREVGRYKFSVLTRIFSYSERSRLVLFSYDKSFESVLDQLTHTNYSYKGIMIPEVKGYEVLSVDDIGEPNTILWYGRYNSK